jgi:hypothetical protein
MSGELSTPVPALSQELGETPGPARGVQRHARRPAGEIFSYYRLVGSEQPAARLRVIAGRHLRVDGDGADPLNQHAAVPQLLVIQQPPDLRQPGVGEGAVVVPGPGVQQRDAFDAEQISEGILIDHERRS